MRILNALGTSYIAGAVAAVVLSPAHSAPIAAPSANVRLNAAPAAALQAGFHRRHVWRKAAWVDESWRRSVPGPYVWENVWDDARSGDHPPWASAYAGYLNFWCSPGFGEYYRHWPRS